MFNAAIAPGVSAPQALGLEIWQVLPLIRHIIASKKVVAIDIVELNPGLDLDNKTANLAANIIYDILNTLQKGN